MLRALIDIYMHKTGDTETQFFKWLNRIYHEFPNMTDNEVFKIAKERLEHV